MWPCLLMLHLFQTSEVSKRISFAICKEKSHLTSPKVHLKTFSSLITGNFQRSMTMWRILEHKRLFNWQIVSTYRLMKHQRNGLPSFRTYLETLISAERKKPTPLISGLIMFSRNQNFFKRTSKNGPYHTCLADRISRRREGLLTSQSDKDKNQEPHFTKPAGQPPKNKDKCSEKG